MENAKKNKKNTVVRLIMMVLGNILIGIGIALFKAAAFGSDPHSAMVFTIVDKVNAAFNVTVSFSIIFYIVSALYLIFQLIFLRRTVGLGTLANIFGVGYFTDLTLTLLNKITPDPAVGIRIAYLLLGLIVVSFGVAMYQSSDLGVGPYDSLAMILDDRLPVPYFWCRIFTDGLCVVITVILLKGFGTLVGIGTILSALGLGPIISFFTKYVCAKLLKTGAAEQENR